MIQLYNIKNSRGETVKWLLEELGLPYEVLTIASSTDFVRLGVRKLHPLALIPVLVDGEFTLFETGAICMYLADKQGSFAPPASDFEARGRYYQWISFALTELESNVYEVLNQNWRYPQPLRNALVDENAQRKFFERAQLIENHLTTRPFMLGAQFSVADIMVGAVLRLAGRMGLLKNLPSLHEWVRLLEERPAAARARGAR